MLLFNVRSFTIFVSFSINFIEKVLVEDFLRLFNYHILLKGDIDENDVIDHGSVFIIYKSFVFITMIIIQIYTILSGYQVTRSIQGYTKKSLKLFLVLTLLETVNEFSLVLSFSGYEIYSYFYAITFVIFPIALIVLNKNCVNFVYNHIFVHLNQILWFKNYAHT